VEKVALIYGRTGSLKVGEPTRSVDTDRWRAVQCWREKCTYDEKKVGKTERMYGPNV
jgi:hypothetical protein